MNRFLADTSYFIALEVSDDQNHEAGQQHWSRLTKSFPQLVTTSYVFGELVTFFNNRRQHAKAAEVGDKLLRSAAILLVHVDETLFFDAWQYFLKHRDKTYSLTDCVSFCVMKEFGIQTALTFDRHFTQAGFRMLP